MTIAFPNETSEYRAARSHLLEAEVGLRRSMEAVASARRALPRGGEVPEDYVFQGLREDGSIGDVRFSELFVPGKNSLPLYSFMFPRSRNDDRPGPASGATAMLPLAEGPVSLVYGTAQPTRRRCPTHRAAHELCGCRQNTC